jgi:enoyl-CoA hydratase
MSQVHLERDGRVTLLRIDRPPANAVDLAFAAELLDVLHALQSEPWGAVVLAGGPRFFSAGIDVKLVVTYTEAQRQQMVEAVEALVGGWYHEPRPVVTAVTGHAAGGGLILAMCGDHRVCADDPAVKLSLPEVRIGIPFPTAPMEVVRRELSPAAARRLALIGETIGPQEALRLGVVDELVPPDQVVPRAVAVARDLAVMPPDAWRKTKAALRGG